MTHCDGVVLVIPLKLDPQVLQEVTFFGQFEASLVQTKGINGSQGWYGDTTIIHVEKDDHVLLVQEALGVLRLLEAVTDQKLDEVEEPEVRSKDGSIWGMVQLKPGLSYEFGAISTLVTPGWLGKMWLRS